MATNAIPYRSDSARQPYERAFPRRSIASRAATNALGPRKLTAGNALDGTNPNRSRRLNAVIAMRRLVRSASVCRLYHANVARRDIAACARRQNTLQPRSIAASVPVAAVTNLASTQQQQAQRGTRGL
jgi:hypothetical protein